MEFLETAKKESKCRSSGVKQSCLSENGETSELFISPPSHRISLKSLRRIDILEPEGQCRCEDSLKILQESACITPKAYNLHNKEWGIEFCQKAYFQIINSSITKAQFLLACRSAFYPLNENIFCS